jgi:hypothetical protein
MNFFKILFHLIARGFLGKLSAVGAQHRKKNNVDIS